MSNSGLFNSFGGMGDDGGDDDGEQRHAPLSAAASGAPRQRLLEYAGFPFITARPPDRHPCRAFYGTQGTSS